MIVLVFLVIHIPCNKVYVNGISEGRGKGRGGGGGWFKQACVGVKGNIWESDFPQSIQDYMNALVLIIHLTSKYLQAREFKVSNI